MKTLFLSASRLHLGASYYPEHWPEARWPEDIRLMREAGMTVARLGEFAWSSLEPSAGEFRLELHWLRISTWQHTLLPYLLQTKNDYG